jgi:phage shock protein PspC (stress-responsive transcriptional regulator)
MAIDDGSRRRLYRSRRHRIIGGVAAGIGEYIGVDPTVVRVIWVLASLVLPPILLADVVIYIAFMIIIPPEPDSLDSGGGRQS